MDWSSFRVERSEFVLNDRVRSEVHSFRREGLTGACGGSFTGQLTRATECFFVEKAVFHARPFGRSGFYEAVGGGILSEKFLPQFFLLTLTELLDAAKQGHFEFCGGEHSFGWYRSNG